MGFPRSGRAAPMDFPRAHPKGNPEGQLYQLKENPLNSDSFPFNIIVSFIAMIN